MDKRCACTHVKKSERCEVSGGRARRHQALAIGTVTISPTTVAWQICDDIGATSPTFVHSHGLHGLDDRFCDHCLVLHGLDDRLCDHWHPYLKVDQPWKEWGLGYLTPSQRSSQWRTNSSLSPRILYLRLISLPHSNCSIRCTTGP
jgi:hypothetical protein